MLLLTLATDGSSLSAPSQVAFPTEPMPHGPPPGLGPMCLNVPAGLPTSFAPLMGAVSQFGVSQIPIFNVMSKLPLPPAATSSTPPPPHDVPRRRPGAMAVSQPQQFAAPQPRPGAEGHFGTTSKTNQEESKASRHRGQAMAAGEPEQFARADQPTMEQHASRSPARSQQISEGKTLQGHGQAMAAAEFEQQQQLPQPQQQFQAEQLMSTTTAGLTASANLLMATNQQMMDQMQALASSAQRAAKAAEEAAEAAKQKSEGFRSVVGSDAEGAKSKPRGTLTAETLRQHTKSQNQIRSKSPPLGTENPIDAAKEANTTTNGQWLLLYPIEARSIKADFQAYDGLAVGDILELSAGTDRAEVVTVTKFGSVYFSAPTRFEHAAGSAVRRLIEGTGERYVEAWRAEGSEARASPSSRLKSSLDPRLHRPGQLEC